MCVRYAITSLPDMARTFFGYVEEADFPPRYNIAPTQPVPIVRLERTPLGKRQRHFMLVRWGLIPGWVKDPSTIPLMFNARSETVVERASFRAAMLRRRCLFIADAFYEWLRVPGAKGKGARRPFMIRRTDRRPMGLAGLWEPWLGADGSEIDTGCIVTTGANDSMAAIHERMPAILEEADFEAWLDVDATDVRAAAALLRPAPEAALEIVAIGEAVNSVANDGPHVQAPPAAPERTRDLFD